MEITRNGETRAVIQDLASYEEIQEILALGNRDIEDGKVTPAAEVVQCLRTMGWSDA